MSDFSLVRVDRSNVDQLGFFCLANKKHPGYAAKRSWLQKRFEEGMRIKLVVSSEGRQAGFLEYIPGEHTWRVVHAPGYLVIHCLWVKSSKFPHRGMASALLEDCVEDAMSSGKQGVAVVTSDGPWMASRDVFSKNGFELVDEAPPHYQLLVRGTGKGSRPVFPSDWDERCKRFRGLQLIYTDQCPYIGKAIAELPRVAEQYGVRLRLVELRNAAEAREKMPSPYGVISLVHQGRLLVDHPISATRFRNILRKDLNLEPSDGG